MAKKRTILLYGRTNAGKSAQIGQLAEHVYKTEGKKTRLATADKGGTKTIQHYVDLGIIEPVEMLNTNPFIFLNKVCRGYVRDATGKWVMGKNAEIGLWAFESLRAIAEALMLDLAQKAALGVNIGGNANIAFTVQGDNETLKVGGANMAHYNVVQSRVTEEVWESQKLDGSYVLWTSSVSKDDDQMASGKVLGPDVVGKALTAEVPRWFDLTFRIDGIPAQQGKPERHLLYLGSHVDVGAGNAAGLGNLRMPLDAPALKEIIVEPASIVKALELIDGGYATALEVVRKRMGLPEASKGM